MSLTKKQPLARHANQKTLKVRWGRFILTSFSVVLISALAVGAFGIYLFEDRLKENSVDLNPVAVDEEPTEESPTPPPVFSSIEESFTMAIIGEDSGQGNAAYGTRDHTLNDVNMVLHIYPGWQQATVMSFPRDLIIDIPECVNPETGERVPATTDKINTALTRGGLPCAVETLSSLAGAPIDNALMVGFDGVVALSNAVGGVEVCLTEPINDKHSGLSLDAGYHTLQGDQALGFLRTRYGVGDGSDLSRISNQQVFLSSLLRKLKSEDTLRNPQKIWALADAVTANTVLSSNLASVTTLGNIAYSLKDLNLDQVTFTQVPTYYPEGVNGVMLKEEDAEDLFELVFSNQVVGLTGSTGPGDVGSVKQPEEPVVEEPAPTGIAGLGDSFSVGVNGSLPAPVVPEKVEVSDSVTGQTAAEATCSRGYTG